jgi:hypothetical protein
VDGAAFNVPPNPGIVCTETTTAAVGIARSTPAAAIFAMLPRTPDDFGHVMDDSLHGLQSAHDAKKVIYFTHAKRTRYQIFLVLNNGFLVKQPR